LLSLSWLNYFSDGFRGEWIDCRDDRGLSEYSAIRERVAQLEQSGVLGGRGAMSVGALPMGRGGPLNAPPHVVYEEIQAQDLEWVR